MLRLAWILAAVVAGPGPVAAGTWTVHADGTGDAPTLQAAIDSAAAGDTVEVTAGTYFERIDFRGKAIVVRSLAGPESTVIDALGQGSCVVFRSGEGRDSRLEGFGLIAGRGTSGQFGGTRRGGGVFVRDAEPTILGNWITLNEAFNDFSEPDAGDGGGICCLGVGPGPFVPRIKANRIENNRAGSGGGGIAVIGTMAPEIVDNLIRENHSVSGSGGGLWILAEIPGTRITGNRIEANQAATQGGGIWFAVGSTGIGSLGLHVENNVVVGNTANPLVSMNPPESGGGMWLQDCEAEILSNTLADNAGFSPDSSWGGGILVRGVSSPRIERNIVAFSADGGGIRCDAGASPVLRDNLVWKNRGGESVGSCPGWVGIDGNEVADPGFCDRETGDYALREGSPALVHPAGPLGANPDPGCSATPVRASTWGRIKNRYE